MTEETFLALDWLFLSENHSKGVIHKITDGNLEIVAIKFNDKVDIMVTDLLEV